MSNVGRPSELIIRLSTPEFPTDTEFLLWTRWKVLSLHHVRSGKDGSSKDIFEPLGKQVALCSSIIAVPTAKRGPNRWKLVKGEKLSLDKFKAICFLDCFTHGTSGPILCCGQARVRIARWFPNLPCAPFFTHISIWLMSRISPSLFVSLHVLAMVTTTAGTRQNETVYGNIFSSTSKSFLLRDKTISSHSSWSGGRMSSVTKKNFVRDRLDCCCRS